VNEEIKFSQRVQNSSPCKMTNFKSNLHKCNSGSFVEKKFISTKNPIHTLKGYSSKRRTRRKYSEKQGMLISSCIFNIVT
jgi:hypothetical protein